MKDINKINNGVIIIDCGLGNLFSVKHALLHVGINPTISSDKQLIKNAKVIILPGVGAFGDAMQQLKKLDIIAPIIDHSQSGKLLVGICLGMQLLFNESEEFGNHKGLGIIDGRIRKFSHAIEGQKIRVPQIGWNTIYMPNKQKWENTPLANTNQNEYMYFVHSYYAHPDNKEEILSLTSYESFEYCSAIRKGNIFAFQFHPEKSGKEGLKIYRSFSDLIKY